MLEMCIRGADVIERGEEKKKKIRNYVERFSYLNEARAKEEKAE